MGARRQRHMLWKKLEKLTNDAVPKFFRKPPPSSGYKPHWWILVSDEVIRFLQATKATEIATSIRDALAPFHDPLRNSPLPSEQGGQLAQKILFGKLAWAIFYQVLDALKLLWADDGRKGVRNYHPLLTRVALLSAT